MGGSLFLFDMTFWLYLAALALYIGYLLARRPALQLVPYIQRHIGGNTHKSQIDFKREFHKLTERIKTLRV